MKRFAIGFLIFVFGWLAGIAHSYVAHSKAYDDERFVLDKVEDAMQRKVPFRLLGQWSFYPTPSGYYVTQVKEMK